MVEKKAGNLNDKDILETAFNFFFSIELITLGFIMLTL